MPLGEGYGRKGVPGLLWRRPRLGVHHSRVARLEGVTSQDKLMQELQGERCLRHLCSRSFQNAPLLSEMVHHSVAFRAREDLGYASPACFTKDGLQGDTPFQHS